MVNLVRVFPNKKVTTRLVFCAQSNAGFQAKVKLELNSERYKDTLALGIIDHHWSTLIINNMHTHK